MIAARQKPTRQMLLQQAKSLSHIALQFPSLLIAPATRLTDSLKARVQQTTIRLGLNDEGTCLKSRIKWVSDYYDDHISFEHLRNHAPFTALKIDRQELVAGMKEIVRPQ